jgi:hypothetical protein
MYFMTNTSKGVSLIFMAKWLGVAQRTAWKMAPAVRELMKPDPEGRPPLDDIVELDKKCFSGKPRYNKCVTHKRSAAKAPTNRQFLSSAALGQACSALISSD